MAQRDKANRGPSIDQRCAESVAKTRKMLEEAYSITLEINSKNSTEMQKQEALAKIQEIFEDNVDARVALSFQVDGFREYLEGRLKIELLKDPDNESFRQLKFLDFLGDLPLRLQDLYHDLVTGFSYYGARMPGLNGRVEDAEMYDELPDFSEALIDADRFLRAALNLNLEFDSIFTAPPGTEFDAYLHGGPKIDPLGDF